jgi:hypothetical protein
MMLYVLDPLLGEGGSDCFWESTNPLLNNKAVFMDGGPSWKPEIKLAHEFSLLPHIERYVPNQDSTGSSVWGDVTRACSSISDMQNRLFKLGFGPMPNFRRSGVLLNISPSEEDNDDDPSTYMLGCIVCHVPGLHGCCHKPAAAAAASDTDTDDPRGIPEDLRCYFCCQNPFYEVLFHNDRSQPSSSWKTVPVTATRACFRALPVGTRLLVTVETLARIVPMFQVCFLFIDCVCVCSVCKNKK